MAALVCFGKAQGRESSMDYIAKENDVNLTTICPGLITGPEFCSRNPKATIANLKGAQEMYRSGVLATVDVMRLAEVHVSVYEAAMNESAFGRYICFDQVIETEQQAEKIAEEANMSKNKICGNDEGSTSSVHHSHLRFELSNLKLTSLLSRTTKSCYSQSQQFYLEVPFRSCYVEFIVIEILEALDISLGFLLIQFTHCPSSCLKF